MRTDLNEIGIVSEVLPKGVVEGAIYVELT